MKLRKLLALLLAVSMLFVFAACEKADDDDDDDKDSKKEATETVDENEEEKKSSKKDNDEDEEEEEEEKEEKKSSKKDKYEEKGSDKERVAKYAEAYADDYIASATNDAGTGYIDVDGTTIIMGYQFSVDLPDGAEEQVEALMESGVVISQFEPLFEQIQSEEPAVSSIIIEYRDINGNLLYSKEFK